MLRTSGAPLTLNLAGPLTVLGRWDEAAEVLEHAVETDPLLLHRVELQTFRGMIALFRDDLEFAEAAVEEAHAAYGRDYRCTVHEQEHPLQLEIELRRAQGRPDSALDVLERALATDFISISLEDAWQLLVAGAGACADAAVHRDVDEATREYARDTLATMACRVRRLRSRLPPDRAYHATFTAELRRAEAAGSPHSVGQELVLSAWDAAVSAWEETQQVPSRAHALLYAAEAAAALGDREGAAVRLRRCVRIADDLGAVRLRQQANALARRVRISLGDTGGVESAGHARTHGGGTDRFGLTAREQDVLRLVAEGRSNRQIAEELFISVKTASVHVSNILGKLGVAGRGEAAATAHRLHLLSGEAPAAGNNAIR